MATGVHNPNVCRCIILMMLLASLAPVLAPAIDIDVVSPQKNEESMLEIGERDVSLTGGRAPCPTVQTDGGTAGDAGNTTATAKTQGNDPNTQNVGGCIDTSDTNDWYGITISADKDVVVQLHVPSGADFDLIIWDNTGQNPVGYSFYSDPLERVEFTTNSTTAGTYYVDVGQWTGDGAYTLDYWTNVSVPKPDIGVNSISGPTNATAGDTVDVSYTIENYGPGNLNSSNPYDVIFILSTDDTYDWGDTIIENQITGPHLTAGSNQAMTTQVTIPVDVESDDYHWIVWPDGWGNVTEADEMNNNNASAGTTTITGMPCPNVDDASTGADVGALESDAYDLGAGFSGILTGCVSGGDKADLYKLSMGRGQNIEAVLSADNWDADLDLELWNASAGSTPGLDSSTSLSSNESVSTVGTDADGAADTYFINITQYSGLANYTLEIWTNGTIFIPPYDCGPDSDWGQPNYDAGPIRNTAYQVGGNPDAAGRGCLDPSDTADAYGFSLSGMMGTTVELESDNGTDMYLQLYSTENGIDELVDEMYMSNGTALVDTTSLTTNDLDGGYFIIVNANETDDDWESGWYNLTFTPIAAPLPDIAVTDVNCPEFEERTGFNAFFGVEISSIGGPMETASFDWEMNLIHENGTTVLALLSGSYSDSLDGQDGTIIAEGGQILLDSALITTGNYTCVLTVDGTDVVAESNETNNVFTSELFEIINEDELYADDVDRDGVPNDLDGCPTTPGYSTMDRLGCMDNDGDGYSNGGDAFIYEPTQWNDTDGDLFGDNNGPNDY
ncbi:MAG: CARDB domain-containing protein, partial [Candidatus Thermoplasmatota archaeon]|nr:CARDB domain-containing protein [Candidatus Thermoplasmatota archaeon]